MLLYMLLLPCLNFCIATLSLLDHFSVLDYPYLGIKRDLNMEICYSQRPPANSNTVPSHLRRYWEALILSLEVPNLHIMVQF